MVEDESHASRPPSIAPALYDSTEETISNNREDFIRRRPRSDNASVPVIRPSWRSNLETQLSKCANDFIRGVDAKFTVENKWKAAHLGDCRNRLIGEVRVDARHIRDLDLSGRSAAVDGIRGLSFSDRTLVRKVIGYHSRGVTLFMGRRTAGASPPMFSV